MLVDLLYYLCYSDEEEEEDFSLLPCVLSSRVCVCVCLQELKLSFPVILYMLLVGTSDLNIIFWIR